MKIERFTASNSCSKCGGSALMFILDCSVTRDFLVFFVANGYRELVQYTAAGILYVESDGLIVHGTFGSNKLQIKCKKPNCNDLLNDLEKLLQQTG